MVTRDTDTKIDPSYSRNTDPDTVLDSSFCMYATKALVAAILLCSNWD